MQEFYARALSADGFDRLKAACEAATVAEPGSERLRYQHLRVLFFAPGERPAWMSSAVALAARSGRPDALFLRFLDLDDSLRKTPGDAAASAEAQTALRRAAEAGHPDAMEFLIRRLSEPATYFRYAPREAASVADRLADGAPPPPAPAQEADSMLPAMRYAARFTAARLRLEAPGFEPEERAAGFAVLKEMAAAGDRAPRLPIARALRRGQGVAQNAAQARALLEAAADDAAARVELADMLLAGEGGGPDRARAFDILKDDRLSYIAQRNRVLAAIFLDERRPGPNPRAALAALEQSRSDVDSDLMRAALLAQTKLQTRDAKALAERLSRAAGTGLRRAAIALAQLAFSEHGSFRELEPVRAALTPFAAHGDREARLLLARAQFANLFSTSFKTFRQGDLDDGAIRAAIDEGIAANMAQAFLLRGQLQRRGELFAQDDRAATQDILRAAELGDPQAMHLAGKVYDDGLGAPKNARERLRWWRAAAQRGHLDSRESLASAFTFDTFDKLMTLREGVSEPIMLWSDGLGFRYGGSLTQMNDLSISTMFSGSRLREAPASAVAGAVLEGLRLAPAGAQDARLVALGRSLPAELRLEIERQLARRGLLKSAPDGYFGPEARAAIIAFVAAAEPLAPAQQPGAAAGAATAAPAAPLQAAGGGLDKATLDRARDRAFKAAIAAKTDKERRTAVAGLAALARYGDMPARWAIVRNYHQSASVRQAIGADEATRYALDVLATKPEGAEKAEFDFIFDVTRMFQDRKIALFARAFIDAMRDDARLRDPLELGGILAHVRMAPGGCDALAAEAKRLRLPASEDCAGPIVEGLIAHAQKAGATGADAKARQAAEAGVRALSQ